MTDTPTPPGRLLPAGIYGCDALSVGDWIKTPSAQITPAMIDAFADLTGDRFEIHLTDAAAQRYGFPARVAHGLLVLSVVDGLKYQADATINGIASLGWEWTFRRPVLAGDTLHSVITVDVKRATRTPDRGVLRLAVAVINQDGASVQIGHNLLMASR